jgi:ribosomal protein S27AE
LRKRIFERFKQQPPERRTAHIKVGNAIRSGKLSKKQCAVCGATTVEAHHADYTNPLDVTWLCVEHHRRLHAS